jgi:hypothetical protein
LCSRGLKRSTAVILNTGCGPNLNLGRGAIF